VFEPFVTTKTKGLGLGLAICQKVVTAHGGRLWAESKSSGGAAFHLVLPCPVETPFVSADDSRPLVTCGLAN
jgi:two-component system sensor kinase FixL